MMYLIYSLVALGIVILIIKIIPKTFAVQRDILVEQSQDKIAPLILSLKYMDTWSVWNKRDADLDKDYQGEDGEEGFIVRWKAGEKLGAGEQQIVKLIDDKDNHIIGRKTELRFLKPWKVTNVSLLLAEKKNDNQTRIIWTLEGRLTFPTTIFMSPTKMDKIVGRDFEESLATLKTQLESLD